MKMTIFALSPHSVVKFLTSKKIRILSPLKNLFVTYHLCSCKIFIEFNYSSTCEISI